MNGNCPNQQPPNKGMHQTKGAPSGRFAADHLEAPFAGDARCCTSPVIAPVGLPR